MHIFKIFKVQRLSYRIILKMSNDADQSVVLQAMGWETLKVERKKANAKMMYKLLNNMGFHLSLTYSLIKMT